MSTPTLPPMPSTDTQDVNQELNTGLQNTATPAPAPQGVPMISPDRTDTRIVPSEQQGAAANAGWEHATKMVHPSTQDKRWVPASQISDAMKSGYVNADVPAALTSKPGEQFQGLGSAAKDMAVGAVTPQPVSMVQQAYKGITEDIPAVYKAYEAARSSGASITDAFKTADAKARQINDAKNSLKSAIKEFETHPNQAAWNAVLQLGTILVGGEVAKFGGEVEGSVTHVYDPEAGVPVPVSQKAGILQKAKQFVSPEAATQPEAQTAFRGGAQASASDAGVASQVPAANASSSVRTLMTKPIAEAARVENNLYSTINDAAEIDMKSLYDRQEELQDTLDDPTQIANKSALQQELKTTQTNIAGGEAKVTAKLGENASDLITKAKAATQQRYAMEVGDQKLFNNESVVSGNTAHGADETIKVDAAIRQAENLDKPSKFAPRGTPTRLEQMFGEDGAKAFKQGLYDAHKSGQTVLTRNRIIEIFGGTTGGLGLLYKLFR